MKLHLCWGSERLTLILCILMGTKLCLREISSQEITTCRETKIHEIIVQDPNKPVKFNLCFVNLNVSTTRVELKNSFNVDNISSDKYTFSWRQSTNFSYYLDIVLFNITHHDITYWSLTLKDSSAVYEQSFSLSLPESENSIDFSWNSFMENNLQFYRITCTANNFPRQIQLVNRCANFVINSVTYNSRNYQRRLTLVYEINTDSAIIKQHLMSLECKVYDFKDKIYSKFQDIKQGETEPAQLCSIQDAAIKVNVYDTAKVIVQVLAYPNTSVFVTKDTNIEDKGWRINSRKLSEVLWSVELFKDNIQEEDMGNYSVKIKSTVEPPVVVNISVLLKDLPEILSTKGVDICPDTNSSVIYRLVRSGLPLSIPSDTTYTVDVVQNNVSKEYLVKLYIDNCTQLIGKDKKVTLKAGSTDLSVHFVLRKNTTLMLCEPRDYVINLTTRIGSKAEFNICVISESHISKGNIGVNFTPYFSSNSLKYQIKVANEGNKHVINFIIYNVTRSDIKFYFIKMKNLQQNSLELIINLFLVAEPPYLCDQNTTSVLKDEEIEAKFCIRSYPVLGRDIVINNSKYTINGTSHGVIIDTSINEESFSNYFHIKISNATLNLTTLEFRVISVTNLSFTFCLNITRKLDAATTTTPVYIKLTNNISSIETTELTYSTTSLTPTKTANTDVIIISIIIVIVSIALAVVLIYFFYIKKRMVARKRRSGVSLRYLNKRHYNNVSELKKLSEYSGDMKNIYESKYENIAKSRRMDTGNENHLPDLVTGRFRNDQGLIYVTVDHGDFQKRSSQSMQGKPPKVTSRPSQPFNGHFSIENSTSNYVSIDPLKTRRLQHKHLKS